MKGIISSILFILLFAVNTVNAQGLKANISKAKVGLGKTVKVTYSLDGDGDNFNPPTFEGFTIVSGPNQSSSLSIVNGNYSQNLSISFVLQANEEGKFTFDPATIEVDGELVTSNPITVHVEEGYQAPKTQRQQSSNQRNVYDEMMDKIFVRAIPNKESVYIGEPVVVTYKVYLATNNVRTYDIPNAPAYNGFWAQDIKIPQISLKQEKYKGKTYNVGIIKRVLLTPQKRGEQTIDPLEVDFIVRVRTSGFGFFNNFKDLNIPIKSNALDLDVRALPAGKPSNFSGAVGVFDMETSISDEQINANDAVTLKIKIKGKGNLKFFDIPEIDVPQDIESYDPKLNEKIEIKKNVFDGYKSFEYLLIPRFAGEYKLKPIEFSYFDLRERQYKTITSPEYVVKVTGDDNPNKGAANVNTTITNKDQVALIGKDIMYIKSETSLSEKGSQYFMSFLFWLVCFLPVGGFLALKVMANKRKSDQQNAGAIRNKKANKLAKKRLVVVKKHLDANEKEAFYDELLKALWGYFEDKLGIERAQLSKDLVVAKLQERNVNPGLIGQLSETIENCQMSRFAPSSDGQMQQEYTKVENFITEIDGQLS